MEEFDIMSLQRFYNKKVCVVTFYGEKIVGKVDEYIFPDDNDNGIESIVIKEALCGDLVEVYKNNIKSIQVVS